jgi:O-antigen ligase
MDHALERKDQAPQAAADGGGFDWPAALPVAMVAAFPMLVWPLFVAEPVATLMSDFAPATADNEGGIINRVYFPLALAAAIAVFLGRAAGDGPGFLNPLLVMVWAVLGWALITWLWSVESAVTLRRALLQMVIAAAIMLPVVSARRVDDLLAPVFWIAVGTAALNAFSVATEPAGPLGHEGIYPHKNYLGAVAALISLIVLHGLLAGPFLARIVALPTLAVALGLIVASRSKTSLALALLVPAMAGGLLALRRWLGISPAIVLAAFLALSGLVYAFGALSELWDFEAFATLFFGDPTLTLRTDIWRFALSMIPERPLLGFGYEAFWRAGPASPSLTEATGFVAKMPHAHNGYIDLMLQMGAVGFVLVLALLAGALHIAGRLALAAPGRCHLCLTLLVFSIFYNLLETSFFRSFGLDNLLTTLAIAVAARGVSREDGHARRVSE